MEYGDAKGPEPEVLLDCYGYVSEIWEDGVRAVLVLPDGQELERIFPDGNEFAEAGIHYQDAPFRFRVLKEGPHISHYLTAERPPKDYPGCVEMPEIDLSVFDEPPGTGQDIRDKAQ